MSSHPSDRLNRRSAIVFSLLGFWVCLLRIAEDTELVAPLATRISLLGTGVLGLAVLGFVCRKAAGVSRSVFLLFASALVGELVLGVTGRFSPWNNLPVLGDAGSLHTPIKQLLFGSWAGCGLLLIYLGVRPESHPVGEEMPDSARERRFLKTSMDATKTSCWEVNLKTGELKSTRPSVEWLGYAPEEIPTSRDWWKSLVHPDDVDVSANALADHLAGDSESYECEYRVRGKSGAWYWTLDRGRVIERDESGQPVLIVGTDTDITARKRAEVLVEDTKHQLQRITDSATQLIWIYDLEKKQNVFANPAFADFFNWSPERASSASNRLVREQVHPEDLSVYDGHEENVWEASDEEFLNRELRVRNHAGEWRWLQERDVVLERSDDGRPRQLLGVALDVTERVLGERALVESERNARRHQELLARANRVATLGEMATGLAHELNQPLAAIAFFSEAGQEMLASDPCDIAGVSSVLSSLSQQSLRAGSIVDRIRKFIGKETFVRTAYSLDSLFTDVLSLLESELKDRDVTVEVHVPEALGNIHADRVQIEQVLVNLINNAIDAISECAGADRVIELSAGDCCQGYVEVRVRDSGSGITDDVAAHVFDAFYSTKSQGMGMGLSICRTIIDAHGGRISIEADGDQGTVCRFTLPLDMDSQHVRNA